MQQFTFRPFGRKILVNVTGKMSLSEGSIIQAATVAAPLIGEVIDAGEGEYAEATGVFMESKIKKGDKILFIEGSGSPVRSNGMDLLLMREDNVIGII